MNGQYFLSCINLEQPLIGVIFPCRGFSLSTGFISSITIASMSCYSPISDLLPGALKVNDPVMGKEVGTGDSV